MGNLVFQATLGGQVNLVGPNTASTFNINVPAVAGTMVTTGDSGTVSSSMLASSLSLTTPNIGAATGTSLAVTGGLYSSGAYAGTYTDGIVADYTTGLGRISVGASDGIAFYNGGVASSEKMRIDSSGNVGIGTSSPLNLLNVVKNSAYASAAANAGVALQSDSGATYTAGLHFGTDKSGALSYIQSGSSASYSAVPLCINPLGGNLRVGATSGQLASTNRMEISSASGNGTLGLYSGGATSSTYSIGIWNTYAGTARQIVFYDAGGSTFIGSITTNGSSTTAYNTSSDYRLKENIQPMQNALDVVAQLNPVTYTWKADGSDGQGFIAHELQAVVPDCVTGEKDAEDEDGNPVYQGIDTSFLVATLTAAIQEQQALIKQLQADVAALKV